MEDSKLSFNSRKSLTVHLGEATGSELTNLLTAMSNRIDQLEALLEEHKAEEERPATVPFKLKAAA